MNGPCQAGLEECAQAVERGQQRERLRLSRTLFPSETGHRALFLEGVGFTGSGGWYSGGVSVGLPQAGSLLSLAALCHVEAACSVAHWRTMRLESSLFTLAGF